MKRQTWKVGEYAIRPAGEKDKCFYCGSEIGEEHNKGCVLREKTIVTRLVIDFVDSVPEHWDEEQINFHYNNSSWCASNVLSKLQNRDDWRCLCDVSDFEYLRDATEDDEERWGIVKVENLES